MANTTTKSKHISKKKNNNLLSLLSNNTTIFWLVQFSCIVLFVLVIYHDIFSNLLNFKNLGIFSILPEKVVNYLLKIFGGYGLIQVFAQDIGIPTGNLQMAITHYPISKFMLLFSSGYTLTGDRSETLIATLLYFYLRNILSTDVVASST